MSGNHSWKIAGNLTLAFVLLGGCDDDSTEPTEPDAMVTRSDASVDAAKPDASKLDATIETPGCISPLRPPMTRGANTDYCACDPTVDTKSYCFSSDVVTCWEGADHWSIAKDGPCQPGSDGEGLCAKEGFALPVDERCPSGFSFQAGGVSKPDAGVRTPGCCLRVKTTSNGCSNSGHHVGAPAADGGVDFLTTRCADGTLLRGFVEAFEPTLCCDGVPL